MYLIDVSDVDGDNGIEEMVSSMGIEDARKLMEELPERLVSNTFCFNFRDDDPWN